MNTKKRYQEKTIKEIKKIRKKLRKQNLLSYDLNDLAIELTSVLNTYYYDEVKKYSLPYQLHHIYHCYDIIGRDGLDPRFNILLRNTTNFTGQQYYLYNKETNEFIYLDPAIFNMYIHNVLDTLK